MLTLLDSASEISGWPGGGWIPPPLLKTHFGVSDPNSFLHSKLYIYKELRSKRNMLNPIRLGIWDLWVTRGGGGFHPPYWKPTSECLIQILFYTVSYSYIRSSDPKGFYSSFKTLDLVADQSSAVNSTDASKFRKSKIYKENRRLTFSAGRQKLTMAPRTL